MPADLAAASMLASPVANHPRIEEAFAVPTFEAPALLVAIRGDFTLVNRAPDNGPLTAAQLESNNAPMPAQAIILIFFIIIFFWFGQIYIFKFHSKKRAEILLTHHFNIFRPGLQLVNNKKARRSTGPY
jgi:hypothetical protein